MVRLISDRMSYRNHYMCSGEANSIILFHLNLSYIIIYSDIAIGAPYDGAAGRGAVYIYLGSIDGVMQEASQV